MMVAETGTAISLFVDEEYRRQNLGTIVNLAQVAKLIKSGKNFGIGYILHSNQASSKFYSKFMNFAWIDNVSSIGVKKKTFNGEAPLWGHL